MVKVIKAAPTCFDSVHMKPSSGSHIQCLAKITCLVPMCVSLLMLSVLWQHIPP